MFYGVMCKFVFMWIGIWFVYMCLCIGLLFKVCNVEVLLVGLIVDGFMWYK